MEKLHLKKIELPMDEKPFYYFIMNNTDYFTDYIEHTPTVKEVREEFLLDVPPNIELDNKEVYGIYVKNALVGFLDLLFYYPDKDICMIGYLVIDQEYRKQGIGQQIYDKAISYIHQRGISKVRLGVIKENIPAVRMWEKQGFKTIIEQKTCYGEQLTMECEIDNN